MPIFVYCKDDEKNFNNQKTIKQTFFLKSRLQGFACKIHKHVNVNSVGGKVVIVIWKSKEKKQRVVFYIFVC